MNGDSNNPFPMNDLRPITSSQEPAAAPKSIASGYHTQSSQRSKDIPLFLGAMPLLRLAHAEGSLAL